MPKCPKGLFSQVSRLDFELQVSTSVYQPNNEDCGEGEKRLARGRKKNIGEKEK